ncbi:hypothetical protein ES708_28398 [subsurface metagenome]
MLNFTEHMKRIVHLAEQSQVHVQSENYDTALDDLMNIGINCNEAVQQLDELIHTVSQGKDPDKELFGGPEYGF